MNKEHTPEFIRIMTNYMNEKSNKNDPRHNNLLTLLEQRNKELLRVASDQEMFGLEKIYYDALDNKGIANRVKYMKENGHPTKKVQMKKMIRIIEGKFHENEVDSQRTVFTRDFIQNKLQLNRNLTNQSLNTHLQKPSKNISLNNEYKENYLLPKIIKKTERKKIDILLSSPIVRKTICNSVSVNTTVHPSEHNISELSYSMNQNKNKSSNYKNLKTVKINKKDYSILLSRLVNQPNTNQCIKIIVNLLLTREKHRKIDSIIHNIQEKESHIIASSNAAIENMKRMKKKEESLSMKYDKFYKVYGDFENF